MQELAKPFIKDKEIEEAFVKRRPVDISRIHELATPKAITSVDHNLREDELKK